MDNQIYTKIRALQNRLFSRQFLGPNSGDGRFDAQTIRKHARDDIDFIDGCDRYDDARVLYSRLFQNSRRSAVPANRHDVQLFIYPSQRILIDIHNDNIMLGVREQFRDVISDHTSTNYNRSHRFGLVSIILFRPAIAASPTLDPRTSIRSVCSS